MLRARIAVVIDEETDVEALETAVANGIAAAADAEGLTLRQLQLAATGDPQWMFEGPPDHSSHDVGP
jgi:hypothetical protein